MFVFHIHPFIHVLFIDQHVWFVSSLLVFPTALLCTSSRYYCDHCYHYIIIVIIIIIVVDVFGIN